MIENLDSRCYFLPWNACCGRGTTRLTFLWKFMLRTGGKSEVVPEKWEQNRGLTSYCTFCDFGVNFP